jgi:hypothetical protein
MPELVDLKKYSVSRNYYLQLVRPLFNDDKFQSKSALKTLLQDDLHKAFWRPEGPLPFDNALAGKFQEVLDCYMTVKHKQLHAQLGSLAGIGGDTVVKALENGKLVDIATTQFKTVGSEDKHTVQENIQKASWQLCGYGGEKPVGTSEKVVEVVLYRTRAFEAYTAVAWAELIKEALDEGYSQNDKKASAVELFTTVNIIRITTATKSFAFKVHADGRVTTESEVDTVKRGFIFDGGKLKQHWEWLRTDWWPKNVHPHPNKAAMITATRNKGIGSKDAYPNLPFQPG